MNVLFYSSKRATAVEDLQEYVCTHDSHEKSEVFRSCEDLIRRFQEPGKTPKIAVLCAADAEELTAFISYGNLFANTQLVLILPDHRLVTVAKALSINPRFITYSDGCVEDIKAVLGKMLSRMSKKHHEAPAAYGSGQLKKKTVGGNRSGQN